MNEILCVWNASSSSQPATSQEKVRKKQILLQKDRSIPTDNMSVAQESSSDREVEKLFRGFGYLDNSIAVDMPGNN